MLARTRAITSLVRAFPFRDDQKAVKHFVNTSIARDWDRLRWFLAAHYKFNRRSDSPFWQDVRSQVDISGLEPALELFKAKGPLSLLPRAIRTSLNESMGIFFYGLHGLDCILLGQHVPHAAIAGEPLGEWRKRRQMALDFAGKGHPAGWVSKMAPYL